MLCQECNSLKEISKEVEYLLKNKHSNPIKNKSPRKYWYWSKSLFSLILLNFAWNFFHLKINQYDRNIITINIHVSPSSLFPTIHLDSQLKRHIYLFAPFYTTIFSTFHLSYFHFHFYTWDFMNGKYSKAPK